MPGRGAAGWPSVASKRAECQAVVIPECEFFGGFPMPTSLETVQEFMAPFMKAWPTADATAVGSFFSEDAVYHNGPMEPVKGRAAIEATFAQFMRVGGQVDVDMIHMMAEGQIVMTERVDHLTRADGTTASLPMMGLIEVHDGLVVAWRDYFDLSQLTSQMAGEGNPFG